MRRRGESHRRARLPRIRLRHTGPFTGAHIVAVLEDLGFVCVGHGSETERAVYEREGYLVTIDHEWEGVHLGDPIFNCLRRDLRMSAGALLRRLNAVVGQA